ncbi:TonB-dependent receptor [Polymorphobacter fuscus]|uniref:TonB-dependent receptor n=1 Tax=Sandarakinorhabdus fusca TaxID=1439888 RepID=A0A7C9KKZ4_9SPHN|nr:TonB-dependent receptor [Polymorphobacter fuscus]KAB7648444.1 TonB-dependent receptor [Polymorphobacter fuscus]MQT15964.1 TonB-dependent receptor [Polymorphobacter fuscus]NJC07759.1 outer membrane receptor protein involved in Fe transport [Polymorphobacter fuscus]
MRHHSTRFRAILLASITSGLASAAAAQTTPAQAPAAGAVAQADADEFDDNVIIVTASKRAQTLQDVPISVAVTTGATIEQAQVRDLLDLQTLVPSLRVAQLQSSANTNFIIRGFGNGANNPGIEPSVGVFIDGVYRSRSAAQIGDLPNLERVEVLRGPQSTLFGKNASAGIVSIITRAPQFEFGGSGEFSYGNYNAIIGKADITGPITENIAFSLAGNINRRDGYATDLASGVEFNNRDRWGVRGQLLIRASDDFKIRIIGDYDKIDENCCAVVNVVAGPTVGAIRALGGRIDANNPLALTSTTNFNSINEIKNYGVSAQADWSVSDYDVTFIGAYRGVRSYTDQDSDFTSADLIGRNSADTRIDTYTAEARIASNYDGFFNFLLGAYYFHENIEFSPTLTYGRDFRNYANLLSNANGAVLPGGNYIGLETLLRPFGVAAGSFGAAGQGMFENYDYKNRAISAFGQADFSITDSLTATVGFNYTRDRKDVASNTVSTDVFSSLDLTALGTRLPAALAPLLNGLKPLQFLPPYLNFPNQFEDGKTRDNDLSYTLRLAYRLDDNLNAYATYATGFKASSWNLSRDSRPTPGDLALIRQAGLGLANLTSGTRFAGPENAEVYEVGLKGQYTGFGFNLAVFQQALKGFQGNIFTGTGFVLSNAEKQSTFGVELDTSFTPVRELNLTASLTYLNPKFDSFTGGSALTPTFGTAPTDLTGQRPAGIPEFSLSVGGTYTRNLSDTTKLILHTDYQLESRVAIAQGSDISREVESLNAAITLALGNGFEVTAWGRNLTDAAYLTTIFPGVAQAGTLSGYRNQPRTYGGSVRYRF